MCTVMCVGLYVGRYAVYVVGCGHVCMYVSVGVCRCARVRSFVPA